MLDYEGFCARRINDIKVPDQSHLYLLAVVQVRFDLSNDIVSDIEAIVKTVQFEYPSKIENIEALILGSLLFVLDNSNTTYDLEAFCRFINDLWTNVDLRQNQLIVIYKMFNLISDLIGSRQLPALDLHKVQTLIESDQLLSCY
jgi:hypothetical protein